LNNADEERAIQAIVEYLHQQRKSRVPVTGFTYSQIPLAVFFGEWWNDDLNIVEREPVVLFVVDYPVPLRDRRLNQTIRRLHQAIKKRYEDYCRPQQEIWITAQQILRYA
jgi:hypothetical protein